MIYESEFASESGTNYKVSIETKTGSGTEKFVLGGTPFVTSMDSDGKTMYAPIKSMGATVEMVTGGMPFNVYSGQATGVKVKLTNTTTSKVEWVGYVTPCAYDMDFDNDRETIEIECVDGLAVLKDLRYQSSSKSVETFLNTVFKCLKRAGCYKYLYINDNVQMTANGTESIMSKIRVSESNWFDDKEYEAQSDNDVAMSCYDVLFELMQYMGYTMVADGEDVYIIDYDAMVKGRTKYFRYDISGNTISSPTSVTLSHSHKIVGSSYCQNGTKVSLSEVFNQICVIDDFHKIDSLVDGLDSSKNYTNITASTDPTLLNWVKNDSRFLESEVFTETNGNGSGEPESFVVSLTKANDGKIFMVIAKFYANPLITTHHYSHSTLTTNPVPPYQSESSYNPMMYSKLWDGKGATVVGYFTKQIESKQYSEWKNKDEGGKNWSSKTKDQKLAAFATLANIANVGSKKLVNYVLCLNQDTNHIQHENVKQFPFFTIKKEVPAIFGGTGGYIVLTYIIHTPVLWA